jgi:hypothetical protein
MDLSPKSAGLDRGKTHNGLGKAFGSQSFIRPLSDFPGFFRQTHQCGGVRYRDWRQQDANDTQRSLRFQFVLQIATILVHQMDRGKKLKFVTSVWIGFDGSKTRSACIFCSCPCASCGIRPRGLVRLRGPRTVESLGHRERPRDRWHRLVR